MNKVFAMLVACHSKWSVSHMHADTHEFPILRLPEYLMKHCIHPVEYTRHTNIQKKPQIPFPLLTPSLPLTTHLPTWEYHTFTPQDLHSNIRHDRYNTSHALFAFALDYLCIFGSPVLILLLKYVSCYYILLIILLIQLFLLVFH